MFTLKCLPGGHNSMEWYYEQHGKPCGPIDEKTLRTLLADGLVTYSTRVWNPTLSDWQALGMSLGVTGSQAGSAVASALDEHVCVECRRVFPSSQLIHYGNLWVCGNCKATVFQRLQEGSAITGAKVFPGFWYRVGAKIIDWIITGMVSMLIQSIYMPALNFENMETGKDFSFFALFMMVNMLVSILIPLSYNTFFLGKYGATPGKMALGMKVIMSYGGPVTYGRAALRYLAEMLSSMILMIGYLMAAWDEEVRTLHDRLCETRVVKA